MSNRDSSAGFIQTVRKLLVILEHYKSSVSTFKLALSRCHICGSGKQKQLNFCGSGSPLKKRSRKWKPTRKHLTFWGVGSGIIFDKTWGRNVEAEALLKKEAGSKLGSG